MPDYKNLIGVDPENGVKTENAREYNIKYNISRNNVKHHIIEITDITAPELDVYARFSENQLAHIYEPDLGLFIAESPNVIHRALAAGYEPVSILIEKKQLEKMLCAGYAGNSSDFILPVESEDNTDVTDALMENKADVVDAQVKHNVDRAKTPNGHNTDSDDVAVDNIMAACRDIPVYTAEYDVLTRLTGFALTRGLLCAMRRRALPEAWEVCRSARRIAVLENVMNPTNVGAIFRSAAALGMDAVLLTRGCSDPLYRRSARVSMGTVFQIPWTYIDDLTVACERLKNVNSSGMDMLHAMGFKTASMALRNDTIDINEPQLKDVEKLAVILGTEGEGLKVSTIDASDFTIKIPMFHGVDSLNVAAASAVAFWELGKR